MKTQEEIEQLAQDIFEKNIGSNAELGYIPIKNEDVMDAIKEAFTQCQEDMADKKYTDEDMAKLLQYTLDDAESILLNNGISYEKIKHLLNK